MSPGTPGAPGTAGAPGRPALDTAELFEPDRRDWLRLIGGVLLAAGAIVLFIRKEEAWGDFPLLLAVLLPAVVLYGLGWLGGLRSHADDVRRPEGWQIVFLILGVVLIGFSIAQLIALLGSDDIEQRLLQALIAAVVAGAAYAASFLRRVPVLSLIGGLAALIAWLLVWDKILDPIEEVGTARILLLIFAAIMLAAGLALGSARRPQAVDFITVAGITALTAGLLSLSEGASLLGGFDEEGAKPTEAWNVFILVVSLALMAYGSRAVTRGAGYVGAAGFFAFVYLTGENVVAQAKGNADDVEKFAGWPLLLLLLGIAALAASFLIPRGRIGNLKLGPADGPGGPGDHGGTTPQGVAGEPRPGAGYAPGAGQHPGGHQQGAAWAPPQQQQPPPQQPPPGGETVARPIPPQQPPPPQGG